MIQLQNRQQSIGFQVTNFLIPVYKPLPKIGGFPRRKYMRFIKRKIRYLKKNGKALSLPKLK